MTERDRVWYQKRMRTIIAYMTLLACSGCAAAAAPKGLEYPAARRADVVEDHFGTLVADPYRWLEDADSEETLAWVEAQNELTESYLHDETRGEIEKRLTALWDFERWSVPFKEGKRYFYSHNDGLQNQSVWYVQGSLSSSPEVVIDPNVMSEDGTVAVTSVVPSRDGRKMAYLVSTGGSDWQELRIRDLDENEDLPEVLSWCKFTDVAWLPDGSGFYYNRFSDPGSVDEKNVNRFNKLYLHRLGTQQPEDEFVYGSEDGDLGFAPWITEDGAYLVLFVYRGTDPKNRLYIRELGKDGPFVELCKDEDAMYLPLGNVGATLFVHTDLDAPRGRIVAIDLANAGKDQWREVLAQGPDVIHEAVMAGGKLVICWMHDAHDLLEVYDLDGGPVRNIDLPTIGSVAGISGRQDDQELIFGFTSFLYPTSVYRHDLASGETSVVFAPEIDFDASAYVTEQVFYESADGTTIPMFLVHGKDMKLDGGNPTLLYGYGGFNISLTPSFRVYPLYWIENGGVYAVANIRGGNEYGEKWHQAGILDKKQNVFDDFIAAAEWLIESGTTSTPKLAIMGGSNGGLLTAACMIERPDLFGAVVSAVPVIDMLRYHLFSVGHFWVSDYGNADESAEAFEYLLAYSPLHNIVPGTVYPPTLVTTADTDDRVVPMHAKKFVAALQAADAGDNPILIRVETKAGHGKGKPTTKSIEEFADILTFLVKSLGLATTG